MGDDWRDVSTLSAPFRGDSRLFMDIACPTCATAYEIHDASIGDSGRKVRCAGCGTVWRVFRDRPHEIVSAPSPPEPLVEVAAPPPIAPSEEDVAREAGEMPSEAMASGQAESVEAPQPAIDSEAQSDASVPPARAKILKGRSKTKTHGGGLAGKLFSRRTLLVGGAVVLAAGAFLQRESVVRFVPHSAAVFSALGAPVNLRGIDIRDVKSRMVDDNGVSVLVIEGSLVSVSKAPAAVPRLRFAVLGDRGQEIYVWSAQADRPEIKPGETMTFRRRLAAPPTDGRDVSVRFLAASDMTAGLK